MAKIFSILGTLCSILILEDFRVESSLERISRIEDLFFEMRGYVDLGDSRMNIPLTRFFEWRKSFRSLEHFARF